MTDDQSLIKSALREGTRQKRARVLYSYTPANDDELELQVNDIIKVIEEVEEGWWRGILRGKEGVFPSNFVVEDSSDVFEPIKRMEKQDEKDGSVSVDATDGVVQSSPSHQEIKPKPVRGVGLGNIFQDGVKKLRPTETSSTTQHTEKPFRLSKQPPPPPPSSSSLLENAPKLPPKPVREQARVLYPYEAQNDDELSLKEGDIITVIAKEIEDKGWWKGELNGQVGVFPDNFVELVRVEEVQLRRPERPEKPSITVLVSKGSTKPDISEKPVPSQNLNNTEKVSKIPPPKPPAPELSRKDEKAEKPTPPLPGKKPQLPPPMKKPQRASKPANTSTTTTATVAPSNQSPTLSPTSLVQVSSVALTNGSISLTDDMKVKSLQQEAQDDNIDDSAFDVIEPSPEKLTHLAANRAKAPNRRPPSRIFMNKENDKENGDHQPVWLKDTPKNQDKQSSQTETSSLEKVSVQTEDQQSSPQHKSIPTPPSSSQQKEETTSPVKPPSVNSPLKESSVTSPLPVSEPEQLGTSSNVVVTDVENEITNLRKDIKLLQETTVNKEEFGELQKQVEILKETIESQRSYFSNLVVDLISEIDEEKKLRMALEVQLDRIKKLTATV